MGRYTRKPIIVDAIQWTGEPERLAEIRERIGPRDILIDEEDEQLAFHGHEGTFVANVGDWITWGANGDIYTVEEDAVFQQTHELPAAR